MPDTRTYDTPPITEAVVEFRFEQSLDETNIKAALEKLKEQLPNIEEGVAKEFRFELTKGNLQESSEEKRYRLSDDDGRILLVIAPKMFSVSHLAPYESWDAFEADISRLWDTVYRVSGYRKLTRIGTRYINRLDLKIENDLVEFEKYLDLKICLPDDFPPINGYNLTFTFDIHDIRSKATVKSMVAEPVIIDFGAFILDIDISRTYELPQKKSDIFHYLSSVREHKNMLFETFITDKARELFGV